MPDSNTTPPKIGIEPTARYIGRLERDFETSGSPGFGILRPFSGLLQPDGPRPTGSMGPALEYLTLQPLVVQHIRERTTRETSVETELVEEAAPSSSETGSDQSEGADSTPSDTTTVREYIQSQSSAETDVADSGETPRSDRPSADRGTDLSETVVNRPGTDTDSRPPPDRDRQAEQSGPESFGPGDRGESDSRRGMDAPGRSESLPGTPLDTAATAGGESDAGERGVSVSRPGADTGMRLGDSDRGPPGADDSWDSGPELVFADQSLPGTVSTGRADEPAGPSLTVPTSQATGRAETSGQDPSTRSPGTDSGRKAGADRPSQSPAHSSQSRTHSTQSQQPAQDEGTESVPLSLDRLEQPTLDRFVEQISDELARHERIERERRGL